MSSVRKAVITAAGRGTRQFPASNSVQKELFPLVDVDGYTKPVLQIIVEEVVASGIDEVCIVANPDNLGDIQRHFRAPASALEQKLRAKSWGGPLLDRLSELAGRIHFVVQERQDGYGHAVYQAREWVGGEPFVLMVGDHVYVARERHCVRQALDAWDAFGSPVSTVTAAPESTLSRYGIVTGELIGNRTDVYRITKMVEKPSVEHARAEYRAPGVPEGYYLAFFGINVFPSALFDGLKHLIDTDERERNEIQLTSALNLLLASEDQYIAATINGRRYDMGVPEGLIETQVALALRSPLREHVLNAVAEGASDFGSRQ
ncbi:MAG: sugar phosphate nucleotidyltransferase [Capsulimonadaceae bacterium]|nr:sugar phosphate nucleotidyltransferase [Capsulimonadaceae bacterium]